MIKESDNKLFRQILNIIIITNKKHPEYNPKNNLNIALSTLISFTILLSCNSNSINNSIRTNSMIYYYYLYICITI